VGAEAESSGRSAIQSERCDAVGARGTRARVSRGRRRGRRRERAAGGRWAGWVGSAVFFSEAFFARLD
jgi:hypothetical protein